jgi:hypothetical protein
MAILDHRKISKSILMAVSGSWLKLPVAANSTMRKTNPEISQIRPKDNNL